jgi:hypothetical protein
MTSLREESKLPNFGLMHERQSSLTDQADRRNGSLLVQIAYPNGHAGLWVCDTLQLKETPTLQQLPFTSQSTNYGTDRGAVTMPVLSQGSSELCRTPQLYGSMINRQRISSPRSDAVFAFATNCWRLPLRTPDIRIQSCWLLRVAFVILPTWSFELSIREVSTLPF